MNKGKYFVYSSDFNNLIEFQTIFETNTSSKNKSFDVMKHKRAFHQTIIQKKTKQMTDLKDAEADDSDRGETEQQMADEENVKVR